MPISNTSLLLLTGAGLLAYSRFVKPATSAGTLNFYPASIKNITMDGITPVLTLGLAIQNPSSNQYTLKAVVGSVYANGNMIGNVSMFQQIVVRATAQTIVPLTIRLSLLGIVQDIIQAFNGNGIQQKIELNAYANINDFNVPIKVFYQIP